MENESNFDKQVENLKSKFDTTSNDFKIQSLITRAILMQPEAFTKKYIYDLIGQIVPITSVISEKIDMVINLLANGQTINKVAEETYIVSPSLTVCSKPCESKYVSKTQNH